MTAVRDALPVFAVEAMQAGAGALLGFLAGSHLPCYCPALTHLGLRLASCVGQDPARLARSWDLALEDLLHRTHRCVSPQSVVYEFTAKHAVLSPINASRTSCESALKETCLCMEAASRTEPLDDQDRMLVCICRLADRREIQLVLYQHQSIFTVRQAPICITPVRLFAATGPQCQ